MLRRSRQPLFVVLLLLASLLGSSTTATAATLTVDRVSGTNRYETAVAVSQRAWPTGTPVVFVATGLNFADSVAITAVGGAFGPVLLTTPTALPEVTAKEIVRLNPDLVVVLGGPNAISDDVQREILRIMPAKDKAVDRVAGTNRYETAVAISEEFGQGDVVYLADGADYAAGITAAAAAGINSGVLLTTPRDGLAPVVAKELARLSPSHLIAVGDLAANTVADAGQYATTVTWIEGKDPVQLSADLSAATWESTTDILVASSADFPDALAAAAWAVQAFVPLILTDPSALQSETACEILRLEASGAVIAGGPNAVSNTVQRSITDIKPRDHGCEDSSAIVIPDPLPSTEEVEVTLYELVTSPDSTRAYVVNNAWNSVEVIDLVDREWLGRISVGSNPTDIDISANGKLLYVVNNGSQTISVIDTTKPFDEAEIRQVDMLYSGPNSRRLLSLEASADGNVYLIPARLESVDSAACLQVMDAAYNISELEPLSDPNIPMGAVQGFASADNKLVGFIATDRGTKPPAEPITCTEGDEPEPEPTGTETATEEPTEEPTDPAVENQSQALFTLVNGTWTRVGAWGRSVSEIAYGQVNENGVTTDGSGTATVFEAVNRAAVLGTVTSDSATTYGLAVSPLQSNCPKDRGSPAKCTQLAYAVTSGAEGLGAIDVLDITSGRNVQGSFRVTEQIPLESVVGSYGGKNQPTAVSIQNQAVVTANAQSLVVATQFAVEIIPIG